MKRSFPYIALYALLVCCAPYVAGCGVDRAEPSKQQALSTTIDGQKDDAIRAVKKAELDAVSLVQQAAERNTSFLSYGLMLLSFAAAVAAALMGLVYRRHRDEIKRQEEYIAEIKEAVENTENEVTVARESVEEILKDVQAQVADVARLKGEIQSIQEECHSLMELSRGDYSTIRQFKQMVDQIPPAPTGDSAEPPRMNPDLVREAENVVRSTTEDTLKAHAVLAYDNEDWENAVELWEKILDEEPASDSAKYYASMARYELSKEQESTGDRVKHLKRAIELMENRDDAKRKTLLPAWQMNLADIYEEGSEKDDLLVKSFKNACVLIEKFPQDKFCWSILRIISAKIIKCPYSDKSEGLEKKAFVALNLRYVAFQSLARSQLITTPSERRKHLEEAGQCFAKAMEVEPDAEKAREWVRMLRALFVNLKKQADQDLVMGWIDEWERRIAEMEKE